MEKQEIENAIAECSLTPETDEVVESDGEAMTLQPCVERTASHLTYLNSF